MTIFPLGPSGGPGGGPFDDINDQLGGFFNPTVNTASVARLEVNAGETLDHFQVEYRAGGATFGPIQHGASNGGAQFPAFALNLNAGERLVMVEGWTNVFDGTLELRGLRFTTNFNQQSGVLGAPIGTPFVFDARRVPNGEIMAFFGGQGLFVDRLGVYVRAP